VGEDKCHYQNIKSDQNLDVIVEDEITKFFVERFEGDVTRLERPDKGVKEKWPSDSPHDHAVEAKRPNIINTLIEEPDDEDHGTEESKVYQTPKIFCIFGDWLIFFWLRNNFI